MTDTAVIGQEKAYAALERAAERPGHAYLLVGPRGSGVEDAARAFAAMLIGVADDERGPRLVARGVHPDVVEFEPGAAAYAVGDDVRKRILPEAARAPIEADRKVLIIFEAERLKGSENIASNALLKTLEEPPERTVIMLVTSIAEDLLETIRSRCQRIDFDALSDAAVTRALEADGIPAEEAPVLAALAGGQIARARAFAGPLAAVHAAFADAPRQVDGYGATALRLAQELDAVVGDAVAAVEQRHAEELGEFDGEMERLGYSEREASRLRRRITERHKRELRRARIDVLLEGVTAIESVYRDVLAAPAPALNGTAPVVSVGARPAAAALDACRDAREAFLINEKGIMRLIALLMALPAAGAR